MWSITICISILLISCSNKLEDLPVESPIETGYDKANDVRFIYSERGKVKMELFAEEFLRNGQVKDAYTDLSGGVKALFFDENQNVQSTLTAKYARLYSESNNVLIRDNIEIINNNGEKLETEELVWNQQLERFYTDKPVRITSPTGRVSTGVGMEANQDFTWFRIYQQKGVVPIESFQMSADEEQQKIK